MGGGPSRGGSPLLRVGRGPLGSEPRLVVWAITHPGENIDFFISQHPGWADFDGLAVTHRPAADAFIQWCRRHPEASQELMDHPNGLHWAGNHLGC